jgi:DNA-binding beta-propeller fold protein YncE
MSAARYTRREFLEVGGLALAGLALPDRLAAAPAERRLLYAAVPGIRNYTEWGGIGLLVFDMDAGFRLVRRIPLPAVGKGGVVENVKGICASAATGRVYVSTIRRLVAYDLRTDALLWNREFDKGCDRMAVTPDGATLWVPSLEGPVWYVVDAATGDELARVETNSGAHNTICGAAGTRAYLAGLGSPLLRVADTRARAVVQEVGPFGGVIRPFTVNGAESLCFVNVNDLLGFEVGDLRTGRVLHRVEVPGFQKGPVKRHGCPSHGVGLTPDETELWVCDGANSRVHVFDATPLPAAPPRLLQSIAVRDQPGWVTFTMDGRWAIPSTGEIVDVRTKRIVHRLADETGGPVQSEKVVEVALADGRPVRAGDQFGVGRRAPGRAGA